MFTPLPGTSIRHYEILEELGRGGMGVVFKARDTKLNRSVALKFLPPHLTVDHEATARFVREAQAAAAIDHPNICAIYEISETEDGQTFIVMGYYGGATLREKLEDGPWRTDVAGLDEIVSVFTQILEGLSAAHRAGIVHRDVKPGNIIVADDGRVRILDFGLAKLASGVDVTRDRSTSGTAAYMSPEQVNGDEVDHRSDLWSAGVVLYEMIAGRRPFQGDYDQAVSYAIINKEPESLQAAVPGTNDALADAAAKALRKDPDERFQSADEFIEALSPLVAPAAVRGTFLDLARKPKVAIPLAATLILLAYLGWSWYQDQSRIRWAREQALPELEALADQITWGNDDVSLWHGFVLAREVKEVIPDDPTAQRLWDQLSAAVPILSDPPGAVATISPYGDSSTTIVLGVTPLDSVRIPVVSSHLRLELGGYETLSDLLHRWNQDIRGPDHTYRLMPPGNAGEVYVPGWEDRPFLVGVDHLESREVPDFIISRYEVTNREFKEFVDAGGYADEQYWGHPFIEDGREVTWSAAMAKFVDRTGQPGPATWELGDYPDGEDQHPVAGVSWYEAAAFAQFAGKELPNVYQWAMVAATHGSGVIVPAGNIVDGSGTLPVGTSGAMSVLGTFDMAGNVREWVFNATGEPGRRFVLGGGWSDLAYAFNDGYAQPSMDRSVINGFRLVRYLGSAVDQDILREPISLPFRDYSVEQPVTAGELDSFIRQYAYDKTPLDARIEAVVEEDDYIRQRVSFDASYGGERIEAFFFIPRNAEPPYQTAVVFPGDNGFGGSSSGQLRPSMTMIKAGRAVFRPIMKGTFERKSNLENSMPEPTVLYRDHVIMWSKDIRRSVDYLATRDDVDEKGIFLYGISWGGRMAPIILALEDRFRMAILSVAGLRFQETLPEVDPWNFLPRVKVPVLMLNGEYDFYFPVETSQRPFFEHLGTPEADKKWLIYPGGHSVPPLELAKESLLWMDAWLGKP